MGQLTSSSSNYTWEIDYIQFMTPWMHKSLIAKKVKLTTSVSDNWYYIQQVIDAQCECVYYKSRIMEFGSY